MTKYYTKACNFYFGSVSREKVKKKLSIPLHGNPLISFDVIEVLSRGKSRRISIKKINSLQTGSFEWQKSLGPRHPKERSQMRQIQEKK